MGSKCREYFRLNNFPSCEYVLERNSQKVCFLFCRSSIKQAAENNNREQRQKKSQNLIVNWNLCLVRIRRVGEARARMARKTFLAALCLNQTGSVERVERYFVCSYSHFFFLEHTRRTQLNSRPQSKSLRLFQFFASLLLLADFQFKLSCLIFVCLLYIHFLHHSRIFVNIYHHRSRVDE